jgi:predicted CopG family antitoxin
MATKTISITEEAYERLKSWKKGNESFSDVIRKIGKSRKLSSFAGVLSKDAGEYLEKSVREGRKLSRLREQRQP